MTEMSTTNSKAQYLWGIAVKMTSFGTPVHITLWSVTSQNVFVKCMEFRYKNIVL